MPYDDTLDYLYQLQMHGIRPGLKRIKSLLSLLGHPEQQFQSVHIAGTNGKGSTVAMVSSVLQQAGYRIGAYTSPHLIDFSERITLSGASISHQKIISLTAFIRNEITINAPHIQKEVTFFEFTTALAFLFFAEEGIDLAVVEVGLGGQFDATNVLTPLVTAITQIDFDHERYLGTTLLEIASEKAGIIKEKIPVVTAVFLPEVAFLIKKVADSKNAPLVRMGREINALSGLSNGDGSAKQATTFRFSGRKTYDIELSLPGHHQIDNATVALGMIESLQNYAFSISENAILDGMKSAFLPGRLEMIHRNPVTILDGAHNPAGAKTLGLFLRDLDPSGKGKHWLMFGVMRDKNVKEILSFLLPWTDELVLTSPKGKRALPPEEIAELIAPELAEKNKTRTIERTTRKNMTDAFSYIEAFIQPQDSLVITGSFYLVGEARDLLSRITPFVIRG